MAVRRDATAVAQLNHPKTVTICSVEEAGWKEGVVVHLFTIELVSATSLDRLIPTVWPG